MYRVRRQLLSIAFAALVLVAAAPATEAASGGELLVGFDGGVNTLALKLLGATVLGTFPEIGVAHVYVGDVASFVGAVLRLTGVAFVERNDGLRLAASSWDASSWDASGWDASSWDASSWDSSQWDASSWDASGWDSSSWDSSQWDASSWDASSWDGSSWDASSWDASSWDGLAQDPGYFAQWGLGAANFPDAWAVSASSSAKVCVLDTGVDAAHPDLRSNLWRSASGVYGYNAMGKGAPDDDVGHGTHVAGIVAASAGNGIGITGAADVKVMAVKVMGASGGLEDDLVNGLLFCAKNGARVGSMSLHIDAHSPAVERAVRFAQSRGMLLVASAGNGGSTTVAFPAAYAGVIAVGAALPSGDLAGFSDHGARLDLVAPGWRIASTVPGGTYAAGSGTSQAAPFVAATAALVWDVRPTWSAAQVAAALTSTARDLGEPGKDTMFGYGGLNAGAALFAAAP